MPKFRYIAKDQNGKTKGEIDSSSRQRAIRHLQDSGLVLLHLEKVHAENYEPKKNSGSIGNVLGYLFLVVGLGLTILSWSRFENSSSLSISKPCEIVLTGKFSSQNLDSVEKLVVNFPELPLRLERKIQELGPEKDGQYQLTYTFRTEHAPKYCLVRLQFYGGKSHEFGRLPLAGKPLSAKIPQF